ncbi:MAG TPA: cytochrome c peroxidase [Chitinophagales bacterium]|nr:cytochrome c peroxidase [Chitinophagales bacterium]
MKKKLTLAAVTAASFALILNGCNKPQPLKTLVPHLPATAYSYTVSSSFADNTPSDNEITNNGAALGRVLFYDPRLSLNNSVSCASCHKQSNAFADDMVKSIGYEGISTLRNTPALINESNKATFFWDGRSSSLEEMVLMPVAHHVEMGLERFDIMEKKISSIDFYPALFQKAFGSSEVTSDKISKALAQFVRAMRSNNSPADGNQLSILEQQGRQVFVNFQCNECHRSTNFGGDQIVSSEYNGTSSVSNAANIGLDVEYADKGVGDLNNQSTSAGAFKIPSLRNLVYTAPYMHDGRYETLEEVIEHYNSGVKASAALDDILKDPVTKAPIKMNMTVEEKTALASFLRALSDPSITTDVRFSNPFN